MKEDRLQGQLKHSWPSSDMDRCNTDRFVEKYQVDCVVSFDIYS